MRASENRDRFVCDDQRAGKIVGRAARVAQLIGLAAIQRHRKGDARRVRSGGRRGNNLNLGLIRRRDNGKLDAVQLGRGVEGSPGDVGRNPKVVRLL
ncbi:MAG TPA: hypothetical protein VMN36_00995 [Verrucomicrobiales bacterium]|nr:hypothetical protein [Verrucomicrobiales bacterium]